MNEAMCKPPQCDSVESDLVSLEKRTDQTLQHIRQTKERLSNLFDGLKNSAQVKEDCSKEVQPQPQPKNRICSIENCVGYIDNESEEFNAIITKLEDILK